MRRRFLIDLLLLRGRKASEQARLASSGGVAMHNLFLRGFVVGANQGGGQSFGGGQIFCRICFTKRDGLFLDGGLNHAVVITALDILAVRFKRS